MKPLDLYHSQWIQDYAFRLVQTLKERLLRAQRAIEPSDDRTEVIQRLTNAQVILDYI